MKYHDTFLFKYQLAGMVDMSTATFNRFLRSRKDELLAMGIKPTAKKLPPRGVHYILRELGCE